MLLFALLYVDETNRIGSLMVSVLASRVVDRGLVHVSGHEFIIKLVFATSPLSTLSTNVVRANTGLLGTRIMC
jgi:hypothetical protein